MKTFRDGRALIIVANGYTRRVERPYVIKTFETQGFNCVVCGKEYAGYSGNIVHHVDGNRTNQAASNLVVLCHGCHRKVHDRSRGKFVPVSPPNPEVERRLFELAEKIRFRSRPVKGRGWVLERIDNRTDEAQELFLVEQTATRDSA